MTQTDSRHLTLHCGLEIVLFVAVVSAFRWIWRRVRRQTEVSE